MAKKYGFVSKEPRKFLFLSIVNRLCIGSGPRTALSMDNDFGPLENTNILSSTLVKLYLANPLYTEWHCGLLDTLYSALCDYPADTSRETLI